MPELQVEITALSAEAKQAIEQVRNAALGVVEQMRGLDAKTAGTSQKLAAGFKEAVAPVRSAGAEIGKLAGAFGLAIGGVQLLQQAMAGIGNTFRAAASDADAFFEMARGFGTTAEKLSATAFTVRQAGGDVGDLQQAFRGLSQAIQESGDKASPTAVALERIGLSAAQLKGLSIDEAFITVAEALSKVEDGAERAALSQDILRVRSAALLGLMAGGRAEFEAGAREAAKYGGVISGTAAASADKLGDSLNNLSTVSRAFARSFIPLAETVVGGLAEMGAGALWLRDRFLDLSHAHFPVKVTVTTEGMNVEDLSRLLRTLPREVSIKVAGAEELAKTVEALKSAGDLAARFQALPSRERAQIEGARSTQAPVVVPEGGAASLLGALSPAERKRLLDNLGGQVRATPLVPVAAAEDLARMTESQREAARGALAEMVRLQERIETAEKRQAAAAAKIAETMEADLLAREVALRQRKALEAKILAVRREVPEVPAPRLPERGISPFEPPRAQVRLTREFDLSERRSREIREARVSEFERGAVAAEADHFREASAKLREELAQQPKVLDLVRDSFQSLGRMAEVFHSRALAAVAAIADFIGSLAQLISTLRSIGNLRSQLAGVAETVGAIGGGGSTEKPGPAGAPEAKVGEAFRAGAASIGRAAVGYERAATGVAVAGESIARAGVAYGRAGESMGRAAADFGDAATADAVARRVGSTTAAAARIGGGLSTALSAVSTVSAIAGAVVSFGKLLGGILSSRNDPARQAIGGFRNEWQRQLQTGGRFVGEVEGRGGFVESWRQPLRVAGIRFGRQGRDDTGRQATGRGLDFEPEGLAFDRPRRSSTNQSLQVQVNVNGPMDNKSAREYFTSEDYRQAMQFALSVT